MIAAIGLAWSFEVFGGYAPCPLCLEQRVPYYVAIPVTLAALLTARLGAAVPARVLALVGAGAMVWGQASASIMRGWNGGSGPVRRVALEGQVQRPAAQACWTPSHKRSS